MTDDSPSSDAETPPGMPRWVKVFVLIVVLLILLVLVIMFVVGGDHGLGRHGPGMLTGLALLNFRYSREPPNTWDDTRARGVLPSEDGH